MIRRIVTAIVLVPLAVILIGFAVANRQTVTISFDPFNAADPAYAATLPLFVVIFLLLIVGVLIGGAAAWLRQSRWRAAARRAETENHDLLVENAQLRRRLMMAERGEGAGRDQSSARLALRAPDS